MPPLQLGGIARLDYLPFSDMGRRSWSKYLNGTVGGHYFGENDDAAESGSKIEAWRTTRGQYSSKR